MKEYYDGNLNSNSARDYYIDKVRRIVESYTDENWEEDGAYIVNRDGTKLINIYDNIDVLNCHEYDENLEEYVQSWVDESED